MREAYNNNNYYEMLRIQVYIENMMLGEYENSDDGVVAYIDVLVEGFVDNYETDRLDCLMLILAQSSDYDENTDNSSRYIHSRV